MARRAAIGARRSRPRSVRRIAEHCAGIHITLAMSRAAQRARAQPTPEEARALEGHQILRRLGFRLFQAAIDPAADARLWPDGFAERAGGVDPGKVLGLDRLRRASREHPRPRRTARQRHAVLGDGDRGLVGALVLGEFRAEAPRRRTRSRCRPASPSFPRRSSRRCESGWKRAITNIRHWSEMPKGGHFAAFEQPDLFVQEVREFFRTLR